VKKLFLTLAGIFLTIFLFWSRFYQLDILPASLTHDEVIYAAQAKSYALQSTDLTQSHHPWSLKPIHPMYAEWPTTVMSLGFLINDKPLWATHFSSALMGVLTPFIFGWLLWGIWKNKQLAIIGVVIAATSPLLWQFSRLSYDTFYSVFFYLAGGAIYVNLKDKQRWWSLVLFTIGFFQYQGLKLLLVPWVGLLFLLKFSSFKKAKTQLLKPAGLIVTAAVVVSLIYGFILLPSQKTNNRLSRTIFSGSETIAKQVDTDRRLSLISPWQKYTTNKFTQRGWFMVDRLIGAFNPNLLFRYGEPNTSGFAVWTHGIFYLIDAVLILLGIAAILAKKKTRWGGTLVLFSIVIFSIPDLINTMSEWHLPRTFLAYTMLLVLISWGGWFVWQNRFWRWIVSGIYLISIAHFGYQYFYRYPVTHLDAGTWDERIAATYAGLAINAQSNTQVWIHSNTPEMTFYNYLLYENLITAESLEAIKNTVLSNQDTILKRYYLDSIVVTNDCVDIHQKRISIWQADHNFCKTVEHEMDEVSYKKQEMTRAQRLSISAVLDSRETYFIYGDTICQQYQLPQFVHLQQIQDLNLKQMTQQQFCQKWITDLRGFNQ
jgi:hypothetical protein